MSLWINGKFCGRKPAKRAMAGVALSVAVGLCSKSAAAGPPGADEASALQQNAPRARTANNGFYAELLGSGLYYSINYERFFGDDFSVRAGFGYTEQRNNLSFFGNDNNPSIAELAFPVLANYYVGGADHKLKLGAGATVFYWSGPPQGFLSPEQGFSSGSAGLHGALTLAIGYRYVPHRGGVSFGVTFTPLIEKSVLPWGGMDVGVAF